MLEALKLNPKFDVTGSAEAEKLVDRAAGEKKAGSGG